MDQPELKQRLVSILAADVVGYSRHMGRDELWTVGALESARAVFRTEIERYRGTLIDMTGDSVLASFGTAKGAVEAAVAIQSALHHAQVGAVDEQMRFRVGVHLGDVFVKTDGSIYGDGVNIAARLESLAEPGGIALSDAVERAVRGKIQQPIRHCGARLVKNVSEPLELYAVVLPWQAASTPRITQRRPFSRVAVLSGAVLLLAALSGAMLWFSDRWRVSPRTTAAGSEQAAAQVDASITVLPFTDLSQAADQSYFSDGLSEEVIARLAQNPGLRVIARTSSFAFKTSHASASSIAQQLNVATLLEGSVRRSADRIRVSAQLIRASDSTTLWSGTFERKVLDVFAVQDEIANAVVAALQVKLSRKALRAEADRYVPKPEAYDLYLVGRQLMRARPDHFEERAVEAFAKSVAIDARYGAAHAALAFALVFVAENELDPRVRGPLMDKALTAADQAVAVSPSEPDSFATRGFLRFAARWDIAGAKADLSKALEMDPVAQPTLAKYSYFLMAVGRSDEALTLTRRLKETDPFFAPPWETEARIAAARGDYETAENSLRHAHSILQIDPEAGELVAIVALLNREPERARQLFMKFGNRAHGNWGVALAEQDLEHPAAAKKALQAFIAESPFEFYKLAATHARGHETDLAFADLRKAFDSHDPDMLLILIDPLLANLHTDARYSSILARMGLSAGGGPSSAQQPACQQRLHVPATVGDDVDHDALCMNSIDEPVRFEENLPIFRHTEGSQFVDVRTTIWSGS